MNFLYFFLILFCFFPYLKLLPFNTDSQPNALLVSLVVVMPLLIGKKLKLTKDFQYLAIIAVVAIVLLVAFTNDLMLGIRSSGNYISLFIITLAFYVFFNTIGCIRYKFYKISIWIWFIVGFIQKFVYNGFLLFLVPRNYDGNHIVALSEQGRGVIALAPEATYYGFVCVQFIMFGLINYRYYPKFNYYVGFLLIQLFFLAKSTGAFLNLMIAIGVVLLLNKMLLKRLYKYIILGILVFICVLPIMASSNSRIGNLVNRLVSGENIITSDDSTNERFLHISLSMKGSIESFGIPQGYEIFSDYYKNECFKLNPNEITAYTLMNVVHSSRIMSSIGGLFYELGLLGFVPFIIVIYNLYKCFRNDYYLLFCLVLFIIITFNALPFGQGFNCLLLANMLYLKDKKYADTITNQLPL